MNKLTIQVRRLLPEGKDYFLPGTAELNPNRGKYELAEIIKRKVWLEAIGNFNPMFCTYKGKRTLVKSDEGDLSDPFRCTENYLDTLYIEA